MREGRAGVPVVGGAVGGDAAGAKHRVDGRSLHAWQRNLSLRTTAAASSNPRLVELVPVSRTTPPVRRYVVRVGEASIEVGDDFDAGTLRRRH